MHRLKIEALKMARSNVHGLTIESELDLPGISCTDSPQALMRYGKVERPPIVPGADRGHGISKGRLTLYWRGIGTFLVQSGSEIVVDPDPHAEESLVSLFAMGPVLSALLHQRGFLVLHASVVSIRNAAIGFLGDKGWGKSTTAAALNARGHALVADDVLVVPPSSGDTPMVQPGLGQLKLWPESVAAALSEDPRSLARLHSAVEKRVWKTNLNVGDRSIPLQRLYVLDRGESLRSVPLTPAAALLTLVQHSYLSRLMNSIGGSQENFQQCSKLAKSTPVNRLVRPNDLNGLSQIVDLVELEAGLNGAECSESSQVLSGV